MEYKEIEEMDQQEFNELMEEIMRKMCKVIGVPEKFLDINSNNNKKGKQNYG